VRPSTCGLSRWAVPCCSSVRACRCARRSLRATPSLASSVPTCRGRWLCGRRLAGSAGRRRPRPSRPSPTPAWPPALPARVRSPDSSLPLVGFRF